MCDGDGGDGGGGGDAASAAAASDPAADAAAAAASAAAASDPAGDAAAANAAAAASAANAAAATAAEDSANAAAAQAAATAQANADAQANAAAAVANVTATETTDPDAISGSSGSATVQGGTTDATTEQVDVLADIDFGQSDPDPAAPGTPGEADPGADVDVDVVDQTQEGSTDTDEESQSDADIAVALGLPGAVGLSQSQQRNATIQQLVNRSQAFAPLADLSVVQNTPTQTQAVLDAIQGQVALGENLSQVEEAQLGTIANLNIDRASRPSSRPSLSQTAFSSLPDNVQANVQSVLGNTTNLSDEDAEAIDAAQQTANQGEANAVAIAIDAIGVPQNVQEEQLLEQLQQQPLSVQPDPNTVQQQENQDIISILAETNQITEAQALEALSQNISQGGVGVGSPGGFAAAGFSEITPTVAQVVALNQGSANPTIGFALNDPQGTSVGSRSASDAFAAINPSLTNAVFGIASALGPGAIGAVAGLAGLNENRGLAQLALSNLPESVQNAISTNVTDPISDLFGTISQNIGLSPSDTVSAADIAVAQGEVGGVGEVGAGIGDVGGDPPLPQVTPPSQLTPALPPTPQLPNTLDALAAFSLLPALRQNVPRQQTASPFAPSPFAPSPVNLPPAFSEEDARRLLLSTGQLPLAGIV